VPPPPQRMMTDPGFTAAISFVRGMIAGMEAIHVADAAERKWKTDTLWELVSALEHGVEWHERDNTEDGDER
jgi:hypothetical protein